MFVIYLARRYLWDGLGLAGEVADMSASAGIVYELV